MGSQWIDRADWKVGYLAAVANRKPEDGCCKIS